MVWGTGRALGGRDASPGSAQRLVRLQNGLEVALGERAGHIYGRNTNPTAAALEEKVRDLEGAEAATSFASGMAAISNTLFTLLSPGDRVVSIKDSYGGTNKFFVEFLPRFQIAVSLCDTTDHETIEAVIAEGVQTAVPRNSHESDDQNH